MKIDSIRRREIFVIITDEGEYYERHGNSDWSIRMGESLEPVYDCTELEGLFQEYMSKFNF